MAAISSISNGEAMSSVRTKLNSVITEINLLDPTDWVDYSNTSTIVGWSSFTNKQILYRIVGKQLFFNVLLNGTSNSTSTSFTMPNNAVNIGIFGINRVINNGVNAVGLNTLSVNSSNFIFYSDINGSAWTASGVKLVYIQGFIQIA